VHSIVGGPGVVLNILSADATPVPETIVKRFAIVYSGVISNVDETTGTTNEPRGFVIVFEGLSCVMTVYH
jgi:hypothetical protein